METIQLIEEFLLPHYVKKDIMHNFEHIKRILNLALDMSKKYKDKVDKDLLVFGSYLHGVIYKENIRTEVKDFLKKIGFSDEKIMKIIEVAEGSQKDGKPLSLEAKILHDAHLLEGGETFLIVKSLITGSLRGQSLLETIIYMENNIINKHRCYLPENIEKYKEKETFAFEFLSKLKPYI
ncbi:hypothetical protein [Bacillus cereus group sp. BfR-BA-01380]|uniref:hypothetical protein n=1 Tax=Bacillus cereus group sp. BfR-BA-01380 TaxID=2920324 RepID=UPI001F57FCB6|nr:hypothetical protein [Bacillus cereus group sp. BfR-BA-01380]